MRVYGERERDRQRQTDRQREESEVAHEKGGISHLEKIGGRALPPYNLTLGESSTRSNGDTPSLAAV
jgi:hypothetical protein